jgi:hypothetical protein
MCRVPHGGVVRCLDADEERRADCEVDRTQERDWWNNGVGLSHDSALRLSQVRFAFGDELLLPPATSNVPRLLPKPHLSAGSQNTE